MFLKLQSSYVMDSIKFPGTTMSCWNASSAWNSLAPMRLRWEDAREGSVGRKACR